MLLALAVLAISYAYPLRTWFEQRAHVADLRATESRLHDEIAALQKQQLRWDDPAYIAAQARQRLSYVMPGDIGYTVIGGRAERTTTSGGRVERASHGTSPWWSRVWGTVAAADRTGEPVTP